jgi:hypothetical protein
MRAGAAGVGDGGGVDDGDGVGDGEGVGDGGDDKAMSPPTVTGR